MKEKLEYKNFKNLRDGYDKKVSRLANIRMIIFIIMLLSFILKYYYYPIFFQVVFYLSLVLFIVMVFIHDKYSKIHDYYVKYVQVIETYIDRENGNWKKFLDNGKDFIDEKLCFLSDLDILGDCSLFQYLNVCKTLGGRERLVNRLSNLKMDEKELRLSQDAVLELSKNVSFVLKFQVMIQYYDNKKIHLRREFSNINQENGKRIVDLLVAIIASSIGIILFLLGYFKVISFSYFYGMFFFNLLISYLYELIFKEEFASLDRIVLAYGKLKEVFLLCAQEKFRSVQLKEIQKQIHKCINDIKILDQIDNLNSLRSNLLASLFFNGLFCFPLILLYRFNGFLKYNFKNLEEGVKDIEELESLTSLATIGIVRENYCIPVSCDKVCLGFKNIKHPLLDEHICVGNDFDGKAGVHIITGSNMGGKTSFLRTIGINMILMQAGGLVCADEFQSCYVKIFTSMRVADNIEKGISTFYGELLRIKEMVEYVDQGNMLVLIDEIFKGTNYQDRMYGAKEVIRKLNTKKTIAFITTHDFELCEEDRVHNYYVKEDYEGDQIVFDYKIRLGKSNSTNAKYLMKKLGIID